MNQDTVEPGCVCEGVGHRTICLEVGGAVDEEIGRYAGLTPDAPDRHRIVEVSGLGAVRHDREKVPVAVDTGVTSCATAEQPDLQRVPSLDDTSEDRRDRAELDRMAAPIERRGHWPREGLRERRDRHG